MALHSFVVMAYKDSPYLAACLDSIIAQTVGSKIYITTSTPSDFITSMASKYKVDLLVTESGLGIAHDWNFSLWQAKSKYVTLAHQDDLYLPEYTSRCITAAEKYNNSLICFTDYKELIGSQLRSTTLLLRVKHCILRSFMPFRNNIQSKFLKQVFLSIGCSIAAPSVMYNLDLLKGFQFSSEFSINMDWDGWSRMAVMHGRFIYVNEPLLVHRIHPDSATTIGLAVNARQQEDIRMFRRYWPPFIARIFGKAYSHSYTSNKM